MQLKSYKRNIKVSLEIKNSKNSKTNSIGSKSQTKDFKKRRRLSGLYNNSSSLKMAHI